MGMVKMEAPSGASGFSVEGHEYEVEDGHVEVLEGHVGQAVDHGYRVVGSSVPLEGRPQMVQATMSAARSVVESVSDKELGALLALSEDDQNKFWNMFREGIVGYPAELAKRAAADEAADKAAEKAEQDRLAADKAAADKKAVEDKAAAEKKAAEDKAAAEKSKAK